MKIVLFFILSLFIATTYAQKINSIEKKVFIANVKAFHVSYPIESLSILEGITKNNKKLPLLEKISADAFVTSNKFKQLYELLNTSEINAGSMVEKRTKEFFINQIGSAQRLQVVFENKNYYWIPREIFVKKNNKLIPLLTVDHILFNIKLDSTADSFHFQKFTEYWSDYSEQNFKIIPTNFQSATVEHFIFFKNNNDTKKIEKVLTIHFEYFRPENTFKNGWLITDIIEESDNIHYDLSKARNYIAPIYVREQHKKSNSIEIKSVVNEESNVDEDNVYQNSKKLCIPDSISFKDDYFVPLSLHNLQTISPKLNDCNSALQILKMHQ